MKKIFLGATTLLVLLSGCSKNELLDGQSNTQNDGRVRFAATTNRTVARAAENNPVTAAELQSSVGAFFVKGYVGTEQTAMLDATVTWTGTSWEYSDEPYWPDAAINFLAYANWPAQSTPTIAYNGITATGVTIGEDKADGTGQKDLLVASKAGATKETRTTLTFKHALTQILFKAGNLDATKLKVRIGGIRIVNVANQGDMAVTPTTADAATIAWSNWQGKNTKYVVQGLQVIDATFASTAASGAFSVEAVTPTTAYSAYKQVQTAIGGNNALLLVPQIFTAWDPNVVNDKPANTTKAYIELLAIINDPAKTSSITAAGEAAYYYCGTPKIGVDGTGDEYGKIYIPIESKDLDINEWVAGKCISYIITFGDKGSGSGGGGYDDNNEPVLVPIKFKATVEDWVNVDIPLLTASFSASSDDIKASFIDGFTNQLLNDIAAAKEVKTYRANVTISGKLINDAAISFSNAQNNQIAVGSTVTYNFVGITEWNAKSITMTVPTGWEAKSYLNANPVAVSTVLAGNPISIGGTAENKMVLTRIQ